MRPSPFPLPPVTRPFPLSHRQQTALSRSRDDRAGAATTCARSASSPSPGGGSDRGQRRQLLMRRATPVGPLVTPRSPPRPSRHSLTFPCSLGCETVQAQCRRRATAKPFSACLLQVRALADRGIREVTLLGQNVNSFADRSEHPAEAGSSGAAAEGSPARSAPAGGVYADGFTSVYRPQRDGAVRTHAAFPLSYLLSLRPTRSARKHRQPGGAAVIVLVASSLEARLRAPCRTYPQM